MLFKTTVLHKRQVHIFSCHPCEHHTRLYISRDAAQNPQCLFLWRGALNSGVTVLLEDTPACEVDAQTTNPVINRQPALPPKLSRLKTNWGKCELKGDILCIFYYFLFTTVSVLNTYGKQNSFDFPCRCCLGESVVGRSLAVLLICPNWMVNLTLGFAQISQRSRYGAFRESENHVKSPCWIKARAL